MRDKNLTGTELRTWRLRLGLSQAQLARKLDVTEGTISHWECNRRRISRPHVVRAMLELIERGRH